MAGGITRELYRPPGSQAALSTFCKRWCKRTPLKTRTVRLPSHMARCPPPCPPPSVCIIGLFFPLVVLPLGKYSVNAALDARGWAGAERRVPEWFDGEAERPPALVPEALVADLALATAFLVRTQGQGGNVGTNATRSLHRYHGPAASSSRREATTAAIAATAAVPLAVAGLSRVRRHDSGGRAAPVASTAAANDPRRSGGGYPQNPPNAT